MFLRRYLALGDSISIDDYPALDYEGRGLGSARTGLGAVALLHRNADDLWPEFRSRDLCSLYPGLAVENESFDGATTAGVLGGLGARLESSDETLVTLTAGGNDLLAALPFGPSEREAILRHALANLASIVGCVDELRPHNRLLVGTVYDPSDGTGVLGEMSLGEAELQLLHRFNDGVREICRTSAAELVDIHAHFLGHGASAPAAGRWYWNASPIEPGIRGASEVRRLWLDGLRVEP